MVAQKIVKSLEAHVHGACCRVCVLPAKPRGITPGTICSLHNTVYPSSLLRQHHLRWGQKCLSDMPFYTNTH